MLELGRGKGSPKSAKSLAQLININGTGAIAVKVHKHILPVFDVFPEACKLCDWGCVIVGMNFGRSRDVFFITRVAKRM